MSAMRKEYFRDLLKDCQEICKEMGVEPEDQGPVIAALVQSDSLNGLRKALLSSGFGLGPVLRNFAASQPTSNPQY